MAEPLDDAALDQLFREARTHNAWHDREVTDEQLHAIINLMKMGPTSANCSPARFVFVKSHEAKERLKPHLMGNNRDKTMAAPVCAIIAWDTQFYEYQHKLFPHAPESRDWFTGSEEATFMNGFRNGTLQGGYFIMAARALGLDCGPMSGFDNDGVDREFFPDGRYKSNFLCNIGYGDESVLFPRLPRFEFDEIASII
ncbi:malonic semialdehyde reductase [Dichotomicrobium thermohalophilum]|uniref:Putative NADH dehydrogenase/NAD(P)H nitroreductase BXY53_0424 n=1 Tax=Dichotomicrobium thermohalophilum TaxID=933063 RepID=A0A397Q2J2_9HYPH|nr:malonic semialdehyde reductase [Dichotomicrobium thermohalophilum]RIA55362.1 3-hydroxypropanoate dehydrogenase [Dichotomicrobium thermohalophilum]